MCPDGAPDPVAVWTSSAFIESARSWVAAQLVPGGIRLTGEWQQTHARVWSSTIRFETTAGRVWFKVNGPGTAYEAKLVALLDELCPGLAPQLLGYDDAVAWSITRDGGPMLRSKTKPDELWGYWERLLPRYGEAQLALAADRSRMLACGAPDRGPVQLPLEFDRLLDKLASQPIEQGGLTRQQAAALERVLPAYEGRCAELAASPVPDSLQHDDLHSNNVGWPGEMADLSSVRIIDWGDASIGHPFGTMLATLNSIAFEAGVPVDGRQFHDSRLLRLRDAYLEPFSSLCGVEELRRSVGLARSTGCVTRALAWEGALQEAPLSMIAKYEFPVRTWLLELLEPWVDEVLTV
jgi:Phosphotransferase enzyme family